VLRHQIWEHLAELKRNGRSMVVTTQYVGEAQFCDRVAVISDGRLLAFETPAGLRHHVYGGDVLTVELETAVDATVLSVIEARHDVRGRPTTTGSRTVDVVVDEAGPAIAGLSQALNEQGYAVVAVEEHSVDFDAMFVTLIERSRAEEAQQPTLEPLKR
jgi:ABC-2 type transport system ATP-binding protein